MQAKKIVDQIESDNIIVVCRDADEEVIKIIVDQISWGSRVRGIVKEGQLVEWYERCLRGQHSATLATGLLNRLNNEFKREFPQAVPIQLAEFLQERHYLEIVSPSFWQIAAQ